MSVQSKFFQVTNQVLLEYKTDQYKITASSYAKAGSDSTEVYMYMGEDGHQHCMDMESCISGGQYADAALARHYYGGKDVSGFTLRDEGTDPIYGHDLYVNNHNIGVTIKDANGYELRDNLHINRDTIRLYILTGYVMNNIAGYSIKVKAPITRVSYTDGGGNTVYKRINDYLYLLDWFMPKEELKDRIHWLSNPLYLNSKFYDRYIEIRFPSPLDTALNGSLNPTMNNRNINYVHEHTELDDSGQPYTIYMRGDIDPNMNYIVEFATVQPEYIDMVTEPANEYECTFTTDVPKTFALSRNSNANSFNVRIVEDTANRQVIYYPVYGDLDNEQDMTYDLMMAIDTGAISMLDSADMDHANDGMDDFIEMYGDDTFRWVLINELTVSYNYERIITPDNEEGMTTVTEYITNTIDYTGKGGTNVGEFWKSRFIPSIKEINNMTCKSIIISYTAHLFNRMSNIDIIRTASMTITDPYRYALTMINTDNIVKYKVINKIYKNVISPKNDKDGNVAEKTLRTYYDVTDIVMKPGDDNVAYTQGQMTLRLKHGGSNYMLRVSTLNDDNTQVPYDLSGNTQYKLVFPSTTSSKIEVFPNKDSENYNLGIGSIVFYVSEEKAKAIMQVMSSERYFALTTHVPGNSGQESTIYEGKVEWIG